MENRRSTPVQLPRTTQVAPGTVAPSLPGLEGHAAAPRKLWGPSRGRVPSTRQGHLGPGQFPWGVHYRCQGRRGGLRRRRRLGPVWPSEGRLALQKKLVEAPTFAAADAAAGVITAAAVAGAGASAGGAAGLKSWFQAAAKSSKALQVLWRPLDQATGDDVVDLVHVVCFFSILLLALAHAGARVGQKNGCHRSSCEQWDHVVEGHVLACRRLDFCSRLQRHICWNSAGKRGADAPAAARGDPPRELHGAARPGRTAASSRAARCSCDGQMRGGFPPTRLNMGSTSFQLTS